MKNLRIAHVIALCVVPLLLAIGCSEDQLNYEEPLNTGADVTQNAELAIDEADIIASRVGTELTFRLPIQRVSGQDVDVVVDAAVRTLDRTLVGRTSRETTLSSSMNEVVVTVDGLEADLADGQLTDYVLHYRVYTRSNVIFGRRSVFAAIEKRAIHLLSSDAFYDGLQTHVRVVATEPVSGRPLSGAAVQVYLNGEDDEQLMFSGETDEFGVLSAAVEADEDQLGSRQLVVQIDSELGSEEIERPVQVRRDNRILVTTDKPLYQPGQTIHIRTLTLRAGDLLPAAGEAITIEVMDGKGNKIMKESLEIDEYGIAATQLQLATELNMGEFVIRAVMDDSQTERTVTIDRYRLPRFTTQLSADATFYRPGQEVDVVVQADYIFGEPVAAGSVNARIWQHDVQDTQISEVDAVLDSNGTYLLTFTVPDYFSTEPLSSGDAHVRVDVTVVDGAGEERDGSLVLPVVQHDLLLTAFPAHDLVPGWTNSVHVIATDPTGEPVEVACSADIEGANTEFTTDERGTATISFFLARDAASLSLVIACVSGTGDEVSHFVTVAITDTQERSIAIVSDRSLYTAGEEVGLTLFATAGIERVLLDMVANNRTIDTQEVALEDGAGSATAELPADLAGAVELIAYHLAPDQGLVRANRLVYVEAANDLTITFESDQEEYLPGEDATVSVTVTGPEGQGVAAAVGLQIVDEAVFALQDMRPGSERIFFQLEQEVIQPTENTCGFDIGDVVDEAQNSDEDRERAAEIIFAASQGSPGYGIVVDTYAEQLVFVRAIVSGQLQTDLETVIESAQSRLQDLYGDDYQARYDAAPGLIEDLNNSYYDPWGQAYVFRPETHYGDAADSFYMTGSGPDEILGTSDDVETLVWLDNLIYPYYGEDERGDVMDGDMNAGADFDAEPTAAEDDGSGQAPPGEPSDGGSADSARVRSFFPETLLVEPALITDGSGQASLDVVMADSITTWRVTGMANTQAGELGSSTAGIRVFQPFFLDIDFPPTLTQNDEVEVPVAVFNFLDEAQEIVIEVADPEVEWYDLLSSATTTVNLEPGEVTSVAFRVRVNRVGLHTFQVSGTGGDFPDAIRRVVQVLPDGEEILVTESDRLDDDVTVAVAVPETAIEGGTGVFVKIYPGMFSQVVEGLDSLLQMPSGCFEQTSSTTYPNVLALRYMRETGQVSPEIEERALAFISTGYQRLLSFEVDGGGFEWFGSTPAHRILTAYGLLEFSDMSDVYEVDPAVISRTQAWLASQQETDGRFRAAPEGIHEGATNNFQDSDVRATAYIAYALAESGYTGSEVGTAVSWVKSQISTVDDNYTLALIANLLISNDSTDSAITGVLSDLANAVEHDEGAAFWSSDSQSLTYGSGGGMQMETTALVLYGLIRANAHPDLVDGGITFLVRSKDSFGTWQSTQATILSLRTFIALLENSAEPTDATVTVSVDGDLVQTIDVTQDNSDVVRQVDISTLAAIGDTEVEIGFDGEGSLLYQVVTRYYTPWPELQTEDDLAIDVVYPSDVIAVGESTPVEVTVTNRLSDRADMVMVQIGIPPGFDVDMRSLQQHIEAGRFSRVDRTGSGVDAYLYGMDPGGILAFEFDVVARFPMTVQTAASTAYLYYEPAIRGESQPSTVTVQ